MKRTDLSELDALADMYQGRNKRIMQQASAELRLLRRIERYSDSLITEQYMHCNGCDNDDAALRDGFKHRDNCPVKALEAME